MQSTLQQKTVWGFLQMFLGKSLPLHEILQYVLYCLAFQKKKRRGRKYGYSYWLHNQSTRDYPVQEKTLIKFEFTLKQGMLISWEAKCWGGGGVSNETCHLVFSQYLSLKS